MTLCIMHGHQTAQSLNSETQSTLNRKGNDHECYSSQMHTHDGHFLELAVQYSSDMSIYMIKK